MSKAAAKIAKKVSSRQTKTSPRLLSGGNPQIAKSEGNAPVAAYIATMPGWKRDVGRRVDALIERVVPNVRKAVKWNSPFYGREGRDWFLAVHCFTKYVKMAFFRGASLMPPPPGSSKQKHVRYLDIHEDGAFDENQFADWVRQASLLSGDDGAQRTPSQLIDARIEELGDWRGETLARVRSLIKEADPEVVETSKWRGGPVWEHDGIICTGETYRAVVKLTFAKGASLDDPSRLFNSSLDGNVRRAIDIHEGAKIDAKALKALVRAAVALNASKKGKKA